MGVKLVSSGGGSVEINPPATASSFVATMPARTGNVMLDGPAFSAYASSATSLTTTTFVKVGFQTEEYDTNSNYDTSLSRFTPTVAGYYQVNALVSVSSLPAQVIAIIYKNGAEAKRGAYLGSASLYQVAASVNATVYLNGSTDYIEIYCYQNAATQNSLASSNVMYFQAAMVRGA